MDITRRTFLATSSSAAILGPSLVASVPTAFAAQEQFDSAMHVNPELRHMAPTLQKMTGEMGKLILEQLAAVRKMQPPIAPLPQPAWTEQFIKGPQGSDLRVYVINAKRDSEPRPAILHTHGGGFIMGSAMGSLPILQDIAAELNCVVVCVDYRLAPETRFPGSLEDNYAGLKWLYDNASELGVDRSRIALHGESAGGGHAAMLAIAARDRGEVPLVAQVLIYPMLDDRTGSTRAVPAHVGKLLWTAELNRFGWASLLGVPAGSHKVPRGSVPARVEDLRKLPPTFIGVGSIDLFVREDMEYAQRLVEVGVPTELHVVPGAFHGFELVVPQASISKQFKVSISDALARAFQQKTA